MIWKSIVSPRAIAPATSRWSAMSGFASKTAETVSDFASLVHNLIMDVRDCYRPELHYMRGPGPKWRAKHQRWLGFDSAQSDWQQRMRQQQSLYNNGNRSGADAALVR